MSEEKEKSKKVVQELGYNPNQIIDSTKDVAKGYSPASITQARNTNIQEPQKSRKKIEVETK